MARSDRGFSLVRAAEALQDNVVRSGPVAGAGYTLVGAIVLLGGVGYAVDYWFGTAPWGIVLGLLLGVVVGFYELARMVFWPR
jgi:ATP synthase protein I